MTSDSPSWVKSAINVTSIAHQLNRKNSGGVIVDVVHSENHDPGFDLALMSLCCDGVIMSTGSYGWWGAWLANKTTVYYSNWPRTYSYVSSIMKREDYFPPDWIPIGGPEFRWP